MRFNYIFSLAFVLFYSILQSQTPNIEWQKTFGGTGSEEAFEVKKTNDNGFVAVGTTTSNNGNVTGNHGLTDAWIIKFDTSGNLQWQKTLGGSNIDGIRCVQQTADGGYITTGYTNSVDGDVTSNHGLNDLWVVKLDNSGNIQWQKTFGGTNDDSGNSIQQTNDGGYIVTGHAQSTDGDITENQGQSDLWLIKLDATGNMQWQKTYGTIYFDYGFKVKQTADGNFIILGSYGISLAENTDYWIIKTDASGNIIWQNTFGGTNRESPYDLQITTDGGYIVTGFTLSNDGDVSGNHGQGDLWLIKLNSSGALVWQKTFGGTLNEYAESIQQTSDGGYIMAGMAASANGDLTGNNGSNDFWIIKTDASGNIEWQKNLGGSSLDNGRGILQLSNNEYLVIGGTYSTNGDVMGNHGAYDIWAVKLNRETLNTVENDIKNSITFYPNPAKDHINFKNLPTESVVYITDMSGRKLFSQQYSEKNITINISQLINGVYIIQVENKGKTILSEKLIVKK
jgi:hypothetical protein